MHVMRSERGIAGNIATYLLLASIVAAQARKG